jgi:hypothetical protein
MKIVDFNLFVLALIIGVCISACKNDDAPSNPCANVQEVKADFVIEELVGDRYFEGDTIARSNMVRFRALQNADEYLWILGAETLRTQSFSRTYFPFGWLDVSLVLKRKPNKQCFPNDDGIDSSYRKFYVWGDNLFSGIYQPPKYPYYPIYGTYRGHNISNPTYEYNITLFDTFWVDGINRPTYVGLMTGIPYEKAALNENSRNNASLSGYCNGISPKALNIFFEAGYGKGGGKYSIPYLKGYAWLDRKNINNITIEYAYADTTPAGSRDLKNTTTFIGTKIY